MIKQRVFYFSIILFIVLNIVGSIVMLLLFTPSRFTGSSLSGMINGLLSIILFAFVSLVSLYIYRKRYLNYNYELTKSGRNLKCFIFFISGLIPFLIDSINSDNVFGGLKMLIVPIILSFSFIFRKSKEYNNESFRHKYFLALSINFSNTLLYLFFLLSYFSINSFNKETLNLKNILNSCLLNLPNVFSRLIILFPVLSLITIIILMFTKSNDSNDKDISDSNNFKLN